MAYRKLGTVTTGQAPRSGITNLIDAALGPGSPRRHVGLLDGMDMAQIEARFAPRLGAPSLVAKLLDGGTVTLDKAGAETGMQEKIDALEEDGCTEIVLLCTDELWGLRCRRGTPLFSYEGRVTSCLTALSANQRVVGVLVPRPERAAALEGKPWWTALPCPPVCEAAWPCVEGEGAVADAARTLRWRGADVVLACGMGFGEGHRRIASEASGLHVLLSNELVAKMTAGEVFP